MPRIFDNIEDQLLPALRETIALSDRADICVGYFNLRGWKTLDSHIERWSGGDGHCCRLLVGMQRMPHEEIQTLLGLMKSNDEIDQATALRLKKDLVEQFREQLTVGAPTTKTRQGCGGWPPRSGQGRLLSDSSCVTHCMPSSTYLSVPTPSIPSLAILAAAT